MPSRTSHVRLSPRRSLLEHVDDAQALLVVVEAARDERAEHALAGMAERRVPQVVAERDRLGQLLVQAEHLGDRARDLRHLERVRQPRAVVVAARREEHLRLVLQAAERLGVDDAVAVALERRPDGVLRLGAQPAAAGARSWRPAARGCPARAAPAAREWSHRSPSGSSCRATSGGTPNTSASVCPRSAKVVRVPSATPPRTRAPAHEQRHVLAGVIGARRGRVVAVIGGDRPADRPSRSAGSTSASRAIETLEVARRSPSTSLRCPYSVSKSTRLTNISPRS